MRLKRNSDQAMAKTGETMEREGSTAVSPRLMNLDVLRSVAVLLVFGRHLDPCPRSVSRVAWEITRVWKRGGWIGVDLFFVLSGFLVSGLLFREYQRNDAVNSVRFLIRRGLKIYPAFYVMLALSSGFLVLVLGRSPSIRGELGEIFFLQNYVGFVWPHTWSLAVEEHFYLLLALVITLLARKNGEQRNRFHLLPRVLVLVAALCLGFRALTNARLPESYLSMFIPTHLRIDSLAFGVLLSYYWHFRGLAESANLRRFSPALFVVGSALLALPFVFPVESTRWVLVFGFTLFYLGSGAVLLAMLYRSPSALPMMRLIAKMGTFSYSIYLWHLPVYWLGFPVVGWLSKEWLGLDLSDNWFAYAGFCLIGSIVVGVVAAKLVEYPVLRIRDRFFPSRSAGLPRAS